MLRKKDGWMKNGWIKDGSKHVIKSQKGLQILNIINQIQTFSFLTI
jgi:hypothetical protein